MCMKDEVFIYHIFEAIGKIEEYLKGYTYDLFIADYRTMDAVIRNLEIIGEATNNISAEFQRAHNQIPWHEVISMRNRLIHEYSDVDPDTVWKTIQEDLSKLKRILEKI